MGGGKSDMIKNAGIKMSAEPASGSCSLMKQD